MNNSSFDLLPFLQHLQSGADPMQAPGLTELLQEVEQCARQLIRSTCEIPEADLDDGALDVMTAALEKIKNREILDQYCPERGQSLPRYLANFAFQRTVDLIRSRDREARLGRKLALGKGQIDTSFRDAVQKVNFRPRDRKMTTTPLNALGAQLGNRICWSDHTALENQFLQALQPHRQTWSQRLMIRRGEGKARIDASLEALEVSVNHAVRLSRDPDPSGEAGEWNHDAHQRSLQQQRVVKKRKRKFHHYCVEEMWFPLKSEDLQELLSLKSTSNSQQVRSRARRQLLELLTTGDDKNDRSIGHFFRTIKPDPQEKGLVDLGEGGEE